MLAQFGDRLLLATERTQNEQPLRVQLPDLGAAFTLRGLNAGNRTEQRAQDGTLTIRPGTYLLTARDTVKGTTL